MTEKQKKDWSRIKYPDSYISLGIWISILLFLTYSIEYLEIPLDRLVGMLQRMGLPLPIGIILQILSTSRIWITWNMSGNNPDGLSRFVIRPNHHFTSWLAWSI